ncbi:uncharacterized protein LOC128986358 isoform X2 [Macrosteles quadrilineatus]|uniref:uncharacterized protein LOC128986358 isoform X2 n=1 Tax=Macrosteles quadrilineatus TaxID=74068 RepID=UPI0023E1A760|nr:uncharacterized protein LOC128986358 isoform X2 [Macrosteles quadrilineatus]
MEYIHCDLAMEVAKYLTPKDISTCCSVSLHWREVFGSNEVWKRLCDSEIEEYLRTTPCVVEPTFKLPQHLDTSLPPLSEWRAAFLREQHLWTNWKKRNFKTVEYDLGNENDKKTFSSKHQFVTNDLLIRFFTNSVELWDVRADCQVLKDTISFGKTKWYTPTVLKNGIVTLKGHYDDNGYDHHFIEILKVNQNESTVIIKWHIELNDKELSLKPGCSENSVVDSFFSVRNLKIVITPGGKCIGYFPFTGSVCIKNSFCVWDLETGVELRKEFPYLPLNELIIIGCKSVSNQCEDVMVIVPYSTSTPDSSGHYLGTLECNVYNANKLKFLPFKKMFTLIYREDSEPECSGDNLFPCVITDGFLAFSDCGHEVKEFIRIFNYQTGHELYKLETNGYNTRMIVIGDTFLFTKKTSLPTDYTPGTINSNLYFREVEELLLCSVLPSGRVCEDITGSRYVEEFFANGRTGFVRISFTNEFSDEVCRFNKFFNFAVHFPHDGEVNPACTKVITSPVMRKSINTVHISYVW